MVRWVNKNAGIRGRALFTSHGCHSKVTKVTTIAYKNKALVENADLRLQNTRIAYINVHF